MSAEQVRPTKKQRELLQFIETFIAAHGYSPSYREIMVGLNYNSVATVALHVNSLIKRGHLLRRDGKARSLEVAHPTAIGQVASASIQGVQPHEEKWLVAKIEEFIAGIEDAPAIEQEALDQLHILINALKILGFDTAVQSFNARTQTLHDHSKHHKDE
jgi:SOS-response transcriptional repressor LexA